MPVIVNLVIVKYSLAPLGRVGISLIYETGTIAIFFLRGFSLIFSFPFQIAKITKQVYCFVMESVLVIACIFRRYSAADSVGSAPALPLIRRITL